MPSNKKFTKSLSARLDKAGRLRELYMLLNGTKPAKAMFRIGGAEPERRPCA